MRIRIVPAALIGSILALGGSVPAAAEISDDKIRNLSIGMKKEDVLAVLGKPDSMYADGLNAEGKPAEMLEYRVAGMMDFPDEG